ncbi:MULTISPECIES: hypothetical protein [Pseudomonas]|uniref:Uncharacterized protein n=1 Tax=Pseudomonas peradeniyensis TaxID=2745488 RepID=A0ABT2V681_9PSED|nr:MULTISPECIES: hypothetical protein [Pseudomonas]MCU7237201.1 hypothetical protein [Pseudomonas peradeniyensis]MCU7280659.1 hypothetical protein [Pseudomonas peradeniyensis]
MYFSTSGARLCADGPSNRRGGCLRHPPTCRCIDMATHLQLASLP